MSEQAVSGGQARTETSKKGSITISVVIPTFNRADLVVRAVRSALEQTLPPQEIIVVDDGSTDETAMRLANVAPSVRYLNQQNAGGAAARNLGVRNAQGEWIAFLDSDDVWNPTHLATMVEAIRTTGGRAVIYFSDLRREAGEITSTKWEESGFAPQEPLEILDDATDWVMREHHPMMLQTTLIRKTDFLFCGGFWEVLRTAHDTHFFLKLCIGKPACAVATIGARQGGEDQNRLTVRSGPVKEGRRLNTALLNEDILRRFPEISEPYRRMLRSRAAMARWMVSRSAWKRHDYRVWVGQLLRAGRVDPSYLVAKLLPFIQRRRGH